MDPTHTHTYTVHLSMDTVLQGSVLKFANRWNQNARHSFVAQSVVAEVLKSYPSGQLLQLEDLKVLLEGLIPYSERHFQRLLRLQQVRGSLLRWHSRFQG